MIRKQANEAVITTVRDNFMDPYNFYTIIDMAVKELDPSVIVEPNPKSQKFYDIREKINWRRE